MEGMVFSKTIMLAEEVMQERLFNLDFQLLNDAVLVLIAVFVLFFMASNILFNPVRKVLENRKNKIQNELESAASDKEAAEQMKKEYEAKLKNVNIEAEKILSDARKQALANENIVIAEAREEAAQIIAHAQKEAELEKDKAIDAVRNDIIEIAALLAAKAISEQINVSIQDKLINDTLKEMGKSTWQS